MARRLRLKGLTSRSETQFALRPEQWEPWLEANNRSLATKKGAKFISSFCSKPRKRDCPGNGLLHITSTYFDEPRCLALIRNSQRVVAIHGEKGEQEIVCLGGRDKTLSNRIQDELTRSGFSVKRYARFKGLEFKNICNRNKSRAGLQIELYRGCRRSFFRSLSPKGRRNPTKRFYEFVNTVRAAL